MNRGQRFVKKTLIYTIGSFGSKFLTFLMLPLYTYLISSSDYGQYDLIITTISLLLPLVTLQTQEAIITGMISENIENDQIIKSTLIILILNSLLTLFVIFVINHFIKIAYIEYVCLIIIFKSLFTIVQQYARGLKHTQLYAISGIIYTFIFLVLNVYQLVIIKNGIEGLFISEIIACIITTIFIFLKEETIYKAFFKPLDFKILKWIIIFSLPLVPNAISWWLINASDRYVISLFIGSSANGIYAISYKFANILQTITGLIYLAWQEFSIDEYNSEDKDYLLSNSFNIYAKFLLSITIIGYCLSKYVISFTMAPEYHDAWQYTGWLFLGASFIALSSFLNTGYLVNNKTFKILKGTLLAGIINIVVDVLLVNKIGIFAASISTALSAFILILIRIHDNKKFYDFDVDKKSFLFLTILSTSIFIITSIYKENWLLFLCLLIGMTAFFYFNKEIIVWLFMFLKKKLRGD